MAILLKPGVALLLLAMLLIPCAARMSQNGGQYLVESIRKVGEWSNRVQPKSKTQYHSKELRLWNESWPTIAKLRLESVAEYGFSESADRQYSFSKPCVDDVLRLAYGVSEIDGWALEMQDASAKLPSGSLLANIHWLGMYGECLEISSKQSQTEKLDSSTVLGKYCLVSIGDDTTAEDILLEFDFGICIPRMCNSMDALALFNLVLVGFTDEIHATDADFSDNSALPLDSGAVAVIAILCLLGALVLLGTCLDFWRNHWHQETAANRHTEDVKTEPNENSLLRDGAQPMDQQKFSFQRLDTNGNLYRLLVAFSVLANAKKVLSLEPEQANRNIEALHGIRFISLIWIILTHTYLFSIDFASNLTESVKEIKSFSFQPIINASVCVDTFLLLSGTLASYALLNYVRFKGGLRNISWPKLYLLRFWRLTPPYLMVLAIYATLFKYFGSGPFWQKEFGETCKTSWWTNLLYINNIVHRDSVCMKSVWYLANDMQFFLLTPFFVALLYKWTLLGGIVIFVFMLASSITTGVLTYVNNYPPSFIGYFQNNSLAQRWIHDVYVVPWCRINPYLIGILLGYILYKSNCKIRIHRGLVVLGWCLAAVCNLSVLYGLYDVANGHPLSPSINALYASVHRVAWSVGVAWVILACATGNGGFVNELLSLPIMLPLSRLSYAAYLVQEMVILWYYQNLKVPLFLHHFTMVYLFFRHLVLSFIFALVVNILIEIPSMNLDRSFLRSR